MFDDLHTNLNYNSVKPQAYLVKYNFDNFSSNISSVYNKFEPEF